MRAWCPGRSRGSSGRQRRGSGGEQSALLRTGYAARTDNKDYRIHSELHQRTQNHISHDCCMSKTRVQSIKKSSERLNSFGIENITAKIFDVNVPLSQIDKVNFLK